MGAQVGGIRLAGVIKAMPGQANCGDQYAHFPLEGGQHLVCLCDGLGHGSEAEAAANAALVFIGENRALPLPELVTGADAAVRGTRGCALGVALFDENSKRIDYLGVGNVRAVLLSYQAVRLINNHGIVGGGVRSLKVEGLELDHRGIFLMFTDGIDENIDFSLLGLPPRLNPADLAELMIRTWGSKLDDAGVVAFNV